MRYFAFCLLLCFAFMDDANATCTPQPTPDVGGDYIVQSGSCTDDNEIVVQTGDMLKYDACFLMTTTGAVDVSVSLDAVTYSTAPLSLVDKGATSTDPVLATVALRMYAFAAKFRRIRVEQNGATDAAATLICWDY